MLSWITVCIWYHIPAGFQGPFDPLPLIKTLKLISSWHSAFGPSPVDCDTNHYSTIWPDMDSAVASSFQAELETLMQTSATYECYQELPGATQDLTCQVNQLHSIPAPTAPVPPVPTANHTHGL